MHEQQSYFSHANLQDCIMDAWDAVDNIPVTVTQSEDVFEDCFDLSDLDEPLSVESIISTEQTSDAALYSIFYENATVIKNSLNRSEEYLCADPYCEPVIHSAVATDVEKLAEILPFKPSVQSENTAHAGFTVLQDACSDTECNDVYLKLDDGRTIKTTREALDALSQQEDTTLIHLDATRLSRELEKAGINVQETAMLYQQGLFQTGHIESGCCEPSAGSSQTLFQRSSSVMSYLGGGGGSSGQLLHQSEDHSKHKHCSCGGHYEGGKCEKCGKSAEQAA